MKITLTRSESRAAANAALRSMELLDNPDGEYYTCCLLAAALKEQSLDSSTKDKIVLFYQEMFGLTRDLVTFGGLIEYYFSIHRHDVSIQDMRNLRYTALALFHSVCEAKAGKKASGF